MVSSDPFLLALARKRKQAADLAAGMDTGIGEVAGGFDSMAKLKQALEDKATADTDRKAATDEKAARLKFDTDREARIKEEYEARKAGGFGLKGGGAGGGTDTLGMLRSKLKAPALGDEGIETPPMSVDDAMNVKLRAPMSDLAPDATAQVQDVGDIMQKAGIAPSVMAAPAPDDKARRAKALADKAEADAARAKMRAQPPSAGGGGTSDKARAQKADADRKVALAKEEAMRATAMDANGGVVPPKAAAAKASSTTSPQKLQGLLDDAHRLEELYTKGNILPGGGHAPKWAKGADRVEATAIAHRMALAVPGVFSGSNRLNKQEFQAALDDIIGNPDSFDTNAHNAQRARLIAEKIIEDAKKNGAGATMGSNAGTPDSADIPQGGW